MRPVPRQVDLLQQFVESQGDNPYQKALLEKEGAALKRLVPELLTVRTPPPPMPLPPVPLPQ